MIGDKRGEHLRVVISAEGALDDDVEAMIERVPHDEVDQPDVGSSLFNLRVARPGQLIICS